MALQICIKSVFLSLLAILTCTSFTALSLTSEDCKLRPPENVVFPNADNNSITVQWSCPLPSNSVQDCDEDDGTPFYEVMFWRVYRNNTATKIEIDNGTTRYEIRDLRSRKYYSIKVRISRRIEKSDGVISVTSSQWSDTFTHGAVDGVPDKPLNLTILEKDGKSSSVGLRWDPPMNPNGVIISYVITYKIKPATHPNTPYRSKSTNNTFTTIQHLDDDTWYTFWVTAQTRLGVGLPASIEIQTKSDGINFTPNHAIGLAVGCICILFIIGVVVYGGRYIHRHPETAAVAGTPVTYGSVDDPDIASTSSVSQWNISINQLTFGKRLLTTVDNHHEIHKGTFRRIRSHSNTNVVIKTCSDRTSASRRKLKNEVDILQTIGEHIDIIQLLGFCEDKGNFHEILEYLPSGTLNQYLRENGSKLINSSELLLRIAIGIADGMDFVAQQKITHRDLSTTNVLIGASNMTVKISGFGYASRTGTPLACLVNMPSVRNWRSKSMESLCEGVHTIQSDIWSFGVVLWEILCPGKTPYVELSLAITKKYLREGKRLPKHRNWQDNLYQVMLQCWAKNPSHRPSFTNLAATLTGIKDKKQFYHNFMSEEVQYSSVNMEDYDIVNSGEFDEYDRLDNNNNK